MRRLFHASLVYALMLALALVAAPAGAQTAEWEVLIGRETDDHSLQAQAYFPTVITIVAGDSVNWRLGGLYSHTVTFLAGQPRPPITLPTPDGRSLLNPVVE